MRHVLIFLLGLTPLALGGALFWVAIRWEWVGYTLVIGTMGAVLAFAVYMTGLSIGVRMGLVRELPKWMEREGEEA